VRAASMLAAPFVLELWVVEKLDLTESDFLDAG